MDEKEKMNQKYFQAEILKQYLTQLMEQKKAVEQKVIENSLTKQIIENIKKNDTGQEMWTPVGSGAFMNTTMGNSEKFLVEIGANIFVGETKEKALETLSKTEKEFEKLDEELMMQINEYNTQVKNLEEEITHISKNLK